MVKSSGFSEDYVPDTIRSRYGRPFKRWNNSTFRAERSVSGTDFCCQKQVKSCVVPAEGGRYVIHTLYWLYDFDSLLLVS